MSDRTITKPNTLGPSGPLGQIAGPSADAPAAAVTTPVGTSGQAAAAVGLPTGQEIVGGIDKGRTEVVKDAKDSWEWLKRLIKPVTDTAEEGLHYVEGKAQDVENKGFGATLSDIWKNITDVASSHNANSLIGGGLGVLLAYVLGKTFAGGWIGTGLFAALAIPLAIKGSEWMSGSGGSSYASNTQPRYNGRGHFRQRGYAPQGYEYAPPAYDYSAVAPVQAPMQAFAAAAPEQYRPSPAGTTADDLNAVYLAKYHAPQVTPVSYAPAPTQMAALQPGATPPVMMSDVPNRQ